MFKNIDAIYGIALRVASAGSFLFIESYWKLFKKKSEFLLFKNIDLYIVLHFRVASAGSFYL